jgi:hypothetical protein
MTDLAENSRTRSIGRRGFIAAAAALVAAASSGALWLTWRAADQEQWIEAMLRKNLPGIKLDPDSLARFVREFAQRRELLERRTNLAIRLDQSLSAVARRIPKAERRIERMERLVVSEYLSGSNFFRVQDPRQETIFYQGTIPACGNPFATFRS